MQEISIRNLHLRGKLELLGIAWKQGGTAQGLQKRISFRPKGRKENLLLSGREEEKEFVFSGPRAEKKLSFGPEGRKENVLLSGRA